MDNSRPLLIPAWYREMIWGRLRGGIKLGEIWFRAHPLLLKFIFSDAKLSVQVHPSDEYALPRERSLGKTECWTILEAEPGATLAVGLKRGMTGKQILAAIEDGSIERTELDRGSPRRFHLSSLGNGARARTRHYAV